jgi:hypothetical protein
MRSNVKVTLVEAGDVIQADGSWCIDQVARDNHKLLTIRQNFKDVADPDAPLIAIEGGYDGYYRPHEYVVDREGPAASDCGGLIINGDVVLYSEIVAKEGISVKDKKFLVTEVEKQDKIQGHSQGDRIVTARELTDKNEIDPGGLTIHFEQRASYTGGQMLYDVNVIGRMKPTFGPFEP